MHSIPSMESGFEVGVWVKPVIISISAFLKAAWSIGRGCVVSVDDPLT